MKKRIFSLLLALTLSISLLPMTAFAGKDNYDVSLGMGDLRRGNSICFGSYPQSADGEEGYLDEPIGWRVLHTSAPYLAEAQGVTADNFGDGTYFIFDGTDYETATVFDDGADYFTQREALFLLSNDILDAKPYNTGDTGALWETATLRSWLNGYGDDPGFIDSAFTDFEAGVLVNRIITDVTADKVFLLAFDEASAWQYGLGSESDRQAGITNYADTRLKTPSSADWWLRGRGSDAYIIGNSGELHTEPDTESMFGVRPALMIDKESILFSTVEDFDHAAPLAPVGDGSGAARKFTVWDGAEGFAAVMDDTLLPPYGKATVTVTSLGEGTGYSRISAMLIWGDAKDEENSTVVCYGSIGSAATGDKTFEVPGGIRAGDYTLRIFALSEEGTNPTTYAGSCVDIPVTMGYPAFAVGAKLALTGGTEWLVLEDTDHTEERFTLVMDDFYGYGSHTRLDANAIIGGSQSAACIHFGDDEALSRLPTLDEVEMLNEIRPFDDMSLGYWLADDEESGNYRWVYPNDFVHDEASPDFAATFAYAVRPVLTVLKSAMEVFEPVITEQPRDIDFMTLDGDDALFRAAATGMNLTYQWQVKEGVDFSDIIGADGPTLVIPEGNGLYADGMTFRCKLLSDWAMPVYTREVRLKTFDWEQYGEANAQAGTDFDLSEDGNTFTVRTAAGLGLFASLVNDGANFSGKTVVLDRDIDLSGRIFVPIGDDPYAENVFSGHFDGKMHAVSGMTAVGSYFSGLFGIAEEALIENLLITDGSVDLVQDPEYGGSFYLGGLCGAAVKTTIRNVGIGPVVLGGGDVTRIYRIGGIVGYLIDTKKCIYNSYSFAEIIGRPESEAGGIACRVGGDPIANCYFAGTISGIDFSGGIAGYVKNGALSNCFWLAADGILGAYSEESGVFIPQNTGCTALDAAGLKSSATVTALNAWVTAGNTAEGSGTYETWAVNAGVNGGYPTFKSIIPPARDRDRDVTPARTITVTETSSPLFSGTKGTVTVTADMNNAFSASVEVKLTDTAEDGSSFSLGAGQRAYPFDLSLYLKGTGTKVQPKDGYAVTVSLPVPQALLADMAQLKIVHKAADGKVTTLASELKQVDGVWYIVFKATEFSPYALVVGGLASYDEAAGLPYFTEGDAKTFIGFAAKGRYIAPVGVMVRFAQNDKAFADTADHWADAYIRFVTARELFTGTDQSTFSPDAKMTRAMFATVIGRLYERSFGRVASPNAAFTDCDYSLYYGQYVNWAAANGILAGYGDGHFGPNDPVTREQMAAILYRFAQYMEVPMTDASPASPFADDEAIPAYAMPGVNFCRGAGILTGRQDGTFAPKDTATRAEVAATVERFVTYIVK